jgi:hypothetical protein
VRARFFDDAGIGQFEQQFGQRAGGDGFLGSGVGGQPFAQGGQQVRYGLLQAAWPSVDAHRQGGGFAGEERAQSARRRPRQQEGDDGELRFISGPFPLRAAGTVNLVMHPLRVEAMLADHDQKGPRLADRPLDFRRELVAPAQIEGIDPYRQPP